MFGEEEINLAMSHLVILPLLAEIELIFGADNSLSLSYGCLNHFQLHSDDNSISSVFGHGLNASLDALAKNTCSSRFG